MAINFKQCLNLGKWTDLLIISIEQCQEEFFSHQQFHEQNGRNVNVHLILSHCIPYIIKLKILLILCQIQTDGAATASLSTYFLSIFVGISTCFSSKAILFVGLGI